MILEATLNADYTPGSNQSDELACADWRFLLPSMYLNEVVCLGIPRISTLRVLSSVSGSVSLLVRGEHSTGHDVIPELKNVTIHERDDLFPKLRDISLIFVCDEGEFMKLEDTPGSLERLVDALAPMGSIYLESPGYFRGAKTIAMLQRAVLGGIRSASQSFWITKQSGELRTAVPTHNGNISIYFFRNVLYGMSFRKRFLSHVGRVLSKFGLMNYLSPAQAMLIQKDRNCQNVTQPPAFLCSVAKDGGVNLDDHQFGFSARGKYNSNKIIFYLFEPETPHPDIIVKVTRVRDFNCRLEHEWKMLSRIKQERLAREDSYPDPMFYGYQADLAVLGQKAMRGRPFRTETTGRPSCPVAADAVEWITHLAKHSASRALATPAEVSRQLLKLFEIFDGIYRLSAAHKCFMLQQIDRIAQSTGPFPVVFNHGDAGTWNIIVDHNGKAMFLDWEAAEPHGMPLWDLFYFLRSFGNWVSRREGGSLDTIANFENNFLLNSDFNQMVIDVTRRYCSELDLDVALVAPLFYCCWMHRALRQATWTPNLQEGHFVSLLRNCIDGQDAEGLSRLFEIQ